MLNAYQDDFSIYQEPLKYFYVLNAGLIIISNNFLVREILSISLSEYYD